MFTDDSLLAPDFDETSYLRHALQVSSTSFETEQLRLSRCLEKIETEIHSIVQTNRDALISSVQEVGAAQRTTNAVLATVDQLASSVRRMRHTIHEPYQQMEQRVHELRNVHSCLALVRNVQRYMGVASKLKEAVDGDIVRASRLLREVDDTAAACDFSGIPLVDATAPSVAHAASAIRARLSEALRAAMTTLNPGDLSVCLQCASSMGTLSKTVQGLIAELKRETSRALVKELDNASAFGSESDAAFREAIFGALDKALAQVSSHLRGFGMLWTVLRRRVDPATDAAYWLGLPSADRRAFDGMWTGVLNQIKERLTKLAKRGAVLVAVSTEYGRLTLQLRGFLNSQREALGNVYFDGDDVDDALMSATVDDVVSKLGDDFEPRFRLSLQDRLRERMATVLAKLSTMRPPQGAEGTAIDVRADIRLVASGAAGSGGGAAGSGGGASGARSAPALVVHPVAAAVDPKAFFKCVANEIAAARSDDAILAVVLKAVCDEVDGAFLRRCQDSIKAAPVPELPKVTAGATTAVQLFHVQVANAASVFALEMTALGALLPASHKSHALEVAVAAFYKTVDSLARFTSLIVQPYFNAAAVVLLQTVDSFVHDYYERGVARPAQSALASAVKTRVADFAARYGLMFDARAGTVAARACYGLADRLLQRFTARMLLRRGVGVGVGVGTGAASNHSETMKRLVAEDVAALQDAVNVLHPLDRLARRLSHLRALRSLSSAGATSAEALDALVAEYTAARFHPAVILLSVLSGIPAAAAPALASQLQITPQQLVAMLEALLSASPAAELGGGGGAVAGAVDDAGAGVSAAGASSLSLLSAGAGAGAGAAAGTLDGMTLAVAWDAGRWSVLWDACNAIVADAERAVAGDAPLCDAAVAIRARRAVDALRNV